ncbi:hypothetical protein [Breoghania sp.]|uniref:hypothetical protein n=1 Tax=Breoghania sp. TaxID=2065378 RepID=UPI002AA8DED6|nr:hypothetical protein [Breoghania sp.]
MLPNMTTARAHRPDPIPFTDEHGRRCLRVPLDRHGLRHAVIDEASYRAAIASGISTTWAYNGNGSGHSYVRSWKLPQQRSSNLVQVARVITGAGRGEVIGYANGDRLDLRPENLERRRGRAKRRDIDLVRARTPLRTDP